MNPKNDRKGETGPVQQPVPPAWYGNPAAMNMYNMYNPYMYPPGYGAAGYYPYYQPGMQPFMPQQNQQQDGMNTGALPFRAFTPGGQLSTIQPTTSQLTPPPPEPASGAKKLNESTDELPPLPPGPPPNQPGINETAQSENNGVIQSGPVKFMMNPPRPKLDYQGNSGFNQQNDMLGLSKAGRKKRKKKNQQLARQQQMLQYQKQFQWSQKQQMNLKPNDVPPLPDNQLPPLPPGSPPPPPPPPSSAEQTPKIQPQPLMNVDARPSINFNISGPNKGFQLGQALGTQPAGFQPPAPQLPSMAQVQAQGMKALDEWPSPLRDYVARCYAKCVTQIDKDRVGVILKGKLIRATSDGTLWTKDWNAEPLPLLESDSKAVLNLKEKMNRVSVTSRLGPKSGIVQQPRKRLSLPNKITNRSTYRSDSSSSRSSRSRSSSSSGRSRSRSPRSKKTRTPSKKSDRNHRNDRRSDFNKSHFYSEFGVIGGSEDIEVRKEVLDKRAARFSTPATKSSQPKTQQPSSIVSRLGTKDGGRKKNNVFNYDYGFSDNGNDSGPATGANGDYEVSDLHIVGTCEDLEKAYLRLTAAPEATQVRPKNVLIKSLEMVKAKWLKDRDYRYAFEQLKSIRQDLTVQGVRDELSVEVYETHARIALEMKDVAEFNQCQSQLRILHDEVSNAAQNKLEFRAYAILYFILTKDFTELSKLLSSLSHEDKKDECVSHAVELARAWLVGLHVRIFKLYKTAPKMSSYMIDLFINRERTAYFKVLMKAYRPSIPLDFVKTELELDTDSDVEEFLTSVGNVSFVASSPALIDCKAFPG